MGTILIGAVVGLLQASFFEWTFHRYLLHTPQFSPNAFRSHTLVHHELCKFEDTFHIADEEQDEALSFQWWAGPLLVFINVLPWVGILWGISALGAALPYALFLASISATITLYYVAYEVSHALMHHPRYLWLENFAPFRFLKRHHQIHHVLMRKNLNVLLPIADCLLGTLVRKLPDSAPARTPDSARRIARLHSSRPRRSRPEE